MCSPLFSEYGPYSKCSGVTPDKPYIDRSRVSTQGVVSDHGTSHLQQPGREYCNDTKFPANSHLQLTDSRNR